MSVMSVIAFVMANKAMSAFAAALVLSEVLPQIDKIEANSLLQVVAGLAKAVAKGVVKAALAILSPKKDGDE